MTTLAADRLALLTGTCSYVVRCLATPSWCVSLQNLKSSASCRPSRLIWSPLVLSIDRPGQRHPVQGAQGPGQEPPRASVDRLRVASARPWVAD